MNGNIDNTDSQNISIAELNNLVTKLAPLANLEADTIAKLSDNIDKMTKLSLAHGAGNKCAEAKVDNAMAKI